MTGCAGAEARRDWIMAIALYERAPVHDVLAEPVYRALMLTHLQLGERAEAVRALPRCREAAEHHAGP
ncbi:MAG: hypothetical protein U1F53_07800 [Burkholderiaceae bacterium]